jgi:hypothetical protein
MTRNRLSQLNWGIVGSLMKTIFTLAIGLLVLLFVSNQSGIMISAQQDMSLESQRGLVNQYCVGCHNDKLKSGGFSWAEVDLAHPEQQAERVEKVIRKLRAGMMPPPNARRPEAASLGAFASALADRIDLVAAKQVNIRPPELHRLNRTEYRNSVRDLLGVDIDVTDLLPVDPKASTFDNMADALTVTPALMQGYVRAAEKISRETVGDPKASTTTVGYQDLNKIGRAANQYRYVEGAPFGTRGGLSVIHNFPADGNYVFRASLFVYPSGVALGAKLPEQLQNQQLEFSVDGERVAVFTIDPTMQEFELDAKLVTPPVQVKAGAHRVSAVFISKFDGPVEDQYWLIEQTLSDYSVANKAGMTGLPHLKNFFITGPQNVSGISDTPSRRKIFTCHPGNPSEEESCAKRIISRLSEQALRRSVTAEDLEGLMLQYQTVRNKTDFDGAIQAAVQAILMKPEFLFRFEHVPASVAPGQVFRISDPELASRLSYFLWSSGPDDELLSLANQGRLKDPVVLDRQVKRMLLDPRSEALATNFAGHWLRLGGLEDVLPEAMFYPQFTRNLAVSMRREIELLFDSIVRENSNVVDLLTADYTFVDEILAKYYGIPNVLGGRFQRVQLTDPNRFGILGKGGVLTMTALANRTSPVARGKYVLEVLIGSPPPTPPPNVPPLKEAGGDGEVLSVRERMEQHRKNEPCRSCHQIMDPIGMALENFDPMGVWRIRDGGFPIDPSGQMYDGTKLDGPVSVRQAVLNHSDAFVSNFAERFLEYGLGRVLDYRDMPMVRSIVRGAAKENDHFSAFVLEVVRSPLFQMSKNNNEARR